MTEGTAEPADMATGTISGVMTDLALVSKRLPASADQTRAVARMLDHLSAELRQGAEALRETST